MYTGCYWYAHVGHEGEEYLVTPVMIDEEGKVYFVMIVMDGKQDEQYVMAIVLWWPVN